MQSTTVRLNLKARAILQEIAEEEQEPLSTILQKALDDYRRRVFLRKVGEAYAMLRSDSKAWKKELSERESWDSTVEDGLEEDE